MKKLLFALLLTPLFLLVSACEPSILRVDLMEVSARIVLPSGSNVKNLGLSLEIHNAGGTAVHIRNVELWLHTEDGKLWPSARTSARILEIDQSVGAGERKTMLYILAETTDSIDIPDNLSITVIRINGIPYRAGHVVDDDEV